jgi:hypothetical protein
MRAKNWWHAMNLEISHDGMLNTIASFLNEQELNATLKAAPTGFRLMGINSTMCERR